MDLEQWARDVIDMARPLATKNNNTLTLQVEAGLEPAFTDASRLRQCLLNLVGNACKFTNDGLVSVSIFERDGMLHAKVSDTGIGMTEAQVAGLFQPFYQADASITRRFGGTGLGLSITQKVTALLGGRVTVISAPGAGSTFEIIVPMRLGSDLGPMIEEAQSTSPAA
jgi:signal transduction histidine kinase